MDDSAGLLCAVDVDSEDDEDYVPSEHSDDNFDHHAKQNERQMYVLSVLQQLIWPSPV